MGKVSPRRAANSPERTGNYPARWGGQQNRHQADGNGLERPGKAGGYTPAYPPSPSSSFLWGKEAGEARGSTRPRKTTSQATTNSPPDPRKWPWEAREEGQAYPHISPVPFRVIFMGKVGLWWDERLGFLEDNAVDVALPPLTLKGEDVALDCLLNPILVQVVLEDDGVGLRLQGG